MIKNITIQNYDVLTYKSNGLVVPKTFPPNVNNVTIPRDRYHVRRQNIENMLTYNYIDDAMGYIQRERTPFEARMYLKNYLQEFDDYLKDNNYEWWDVEPLGICHTPPKNNPVICDKMLLFGESYYTSMTFDDPVFWNAVYIYYDSETLLPTGRETFTLVKRIYFISETDENDEYRVSLMMHLRQYDTLTGWAETDRAYLYIYPDRIAYLHDNLDKSIGFTLKPYGQWYGGEQTIQTSNTKMQLNSGQMIGPAWINMWHNAYNPQFNIYSDAEKFAPVFWKYINDHIWNMDESTYPEDKIYGMFHMPNIMTDYAKLHQLYPHYTICYPVTQGKNTIMHAFYPSNYYGAATYLDEDHSIVDNLGYQFMYPMSMLEYQAAQVALAYYSTV